MSGPTRAQYLAAARLIEERGWVQHRYYGEKGQACLTGALKRVAEVPGIYWLVHGTALVRFNDAPGRTKAEVLSALLGLAEVAP